MPRRPRIHLDGVPLHIVQRGHNRQLCFFAEEDYDTYLHWLGEALRKEGCALNAYMLMTNHVGAPRFLSGLVCRFRRSSTTLKLEGGHSGSE